jgi:hypothetical protein
MATNGRRRLCWAEHGVGYEVVCGGFSFVAICAQIWQRVESSMKMSVSNLCTGCFNGVGAIDDFTCIDGLFVMVSMCSRAW